MKTRAVDPRRRFFTACYRKFFLQAPDELRLSGDKAVHMGWSAYYRAWQIRAGPISEIQHAYAL
jgi:hypothetical protein